MKRTQQPDDDLAAWGEMRAFAHVAGYTFEKACRALEALLEGDRWKLGGRFKTVGEFLESISLDTLRATAEARKRIAIRIRELQPAASNRKIAKAIGVHPSTIDRDTAANAAPRSRNVSLIKGAKAPAAANAAPVSGARAARIVERRTTDIATVQGRRAQRERELGDRITDTVFRHACKLGFVETADHPIGPAVEALGSRIRTAGAMQRTRAGL